MRKITQTPNPFKSIVLIGIILLTATPSGAQEIKPSEKGYAAVNGIKVYYEVYLPAGQAGGKSQPIVLLHGAFYTINMNWSELIPELAKQEK